MKKVRTGDRFRTRYSNGDWFDVIAVGESNFDYFNGVVVETCYTKPHGKFRVGDSSQNWLVDQFEVISISEPELNVIL
jgi:hypothetical protein